MNVKTAATSDEMVSLMTKGGYDLVTASGDASLRLIMGKRVQPINTALIPNWKRSIRAWLKATGLMLAAKFTAHLTKWGPELLMYNTKTFPTPPDSWQVVLLSKICRTARAIKAAFRLMMALSTLRTLRCSLKPRSRSWASAIRIN